MKIWAFVDTAPFSSHFTMVLYCHQGCDQGCRQSHSLETVSKPWWYGWVRVRTGLVYSELRISCSTFLVGMDEAVQEVITVKILYFRIFTGNTCFLVDRFVKLWSSRKQVLGVQFWWTLKLNNIIKYVIISILVEGYIFMELESF